MKKTLIVLTIFALIGCGNQSNQNSQKKQNTQTCQKQYTLDEDIGMMLLIGFRGIAIDSTHHIWRDICDYHVGSVILFDYDAPTGTRGRNIKNPNQIKQLCQQLHGLSPTLLIGIDQEGGYVSRLSTRYGFPYIMSAQHSANLGDDTVRHYAHLTADMLHSLGINLNFAPVADVNVNPQCPVIGGLERSFSADEKRVSQLCRIWIDEQQQQDIISCMKHFPGHGSARGDTHKGLVDVSDTWQKRELEPYRNLPTEGIMVMTAHVVNRRLDPSGLPASLSPKITSLLRDTLGFNGVIVTDDLAMGAIANHYTLEQTIRMAIEAGADMLCLSNNGAGGYNADIVPMAVKIIRKLVDEGTISPDRIHQSAMRIRHLQTK